MADNTVILQPIRRVPPERSLPRSTPLKTTPPRRLVLFIQLQHPLASLTRTRPPPALLPYRYRHRREHTSVPRSNVFPNEHVECQCECTAESCRSVRAVLPAAVPSGVRIRHTVTDGRTAAYAGCTGFTDNGAERELEFQVVIDGERSSGGAWIWCRSDADAYG